MNRFNGVITLCVALLCAACQETREDLNSPQSEKDIYRTIGEEIPFETGMRWMDFHKKNSTTSRLASLPACEVSASNVKAMLSSVENLVGVAFHYGIDDLGTTHILAIPVNETMEIWSSASGRILIDGNTGMEIPQDRAAAWANNYKALYPSALWYHFFGKEVFDQMQALSYFQSIDIEQATNPEDLSAQLLLVIWNNDQISTGRTADESGTVYDASNPCPPCATD